MSKIWQLLYRSDQTYEMDVADLVKLLFDARTFNRDHGITGLLLHHCGQFMQMLEGEQHEVQGLYRRISNDPRHRNMAIEVNAPSDRRLFPDWQMSYARAPEIDGHSALAGVGSARDAMSTLRVLGRDYISAMRMVQFLQTEC